MAERWLALDTSGDHASAALTLPGGEVLEEIVTGSRRHARELVPAVARLLEQSAFGPGGLAGVVVSDGPGSFTGLRIGATVAKGLAHVTGIPLRTASALLVLAREAWLESAAGASAGCDQRVLAVTDALRGEVYAALYLVGPGRVEVLRAPAVLAPARLEEWPAPDLRAGTQPQARTLLDLLDVEGGTVGVENLETWEPVYGRPAEAQAKWEAAHGRPLPDSPGHAR